MNNEQLLEIIKAMKLEILEILQNTNLANDKEAQRTLQIIDTMFQQLDIAVEEVIPAESLKAYYAGVDEATKALSLAGVNPVGGLASSITASGQVRSAFTSHVHMEAIAEITDNTMLDLKSAIRTARQNTYFTLMTTLQDVKEDLQSGVIQGKARRVITQRVSESFAKDGMKAFQTIDNRWLNLDTYSEIVVRTQLKQANTNGAIARYRENGQDLVKISGNTPTCHKCHAYRGMVFSLSGEDDRFPPAEGNLPPYHPQCNCSASVYAISFHSDKEINKEVERAKTFDPNKDTRSKSQRDAYNKQQALHRWNNETKKQYARYKAVLGDDAPKTLGGFKRSKKSNSENFKELQRKYREKVKELRG